ncbi:MAG: hypothetical protein RMI91_13450 [Gemmatales bacterium]|nr:hypothetical protein [Gemmatales bacterium]MDW7995651.1 hypothetical protein [Gemmatales bacterium]
MRRSGCREVLIGLENPTSEPLRGVELRAVFKAKKARDYLQAVRRIMAASIMVNGCFILGLDERGPEVFDATWEFAQTAP